MYPFAGISEKITPVVCVATLPPWQLVHVLPELSIGAPALPSFGNDELALLVEVVDKITKPIIVKIEDRSIVFFMFNVLIIFTYRLNCL